jgi:hypothetical protein
VLPDAAQSTCEAPAAQDTLPQGLGSAVRGGNVLVDQDWPPSAEYTATLAVTPPVVSVPRAAQWTWPLAATHDTVLSSPSRWSSVPGAHFIPPSVEYQTVSTGVLVAVSNT